LVNNQNMGAIVLLQHYSTSQIFQPTSSCKHIQIHLMMDRCWRWLKGAGHCNASPEADREDLSSHRTSSPRRRWG
jgi:hypothetical protein